MSSKPTPFQLRCMAAMKDAPNGQRTLNQLARRLKSNQLAVYSAVKALQRQDLAGFWRKGPDQWAVLICFLTRKGEAHDA